MLAVDSGGFGVAAVLVPFVQREGAKLIVARMSGPVEVGRLALVQQVAMYVAGLLIIYTGPLMPAVADAAGRRDVVWLKRAYRRARLLWLAIACGSMAAAVTIFPTVFRIWVGPGFSFSRLELGCYFGSFALVLWAYINYVFLGAFGRVWQAAWVLLVEVVAALLLGIVLLPRFGFAGFFAGMAALALSMSAWMLPRAVGRHMATL
jgi:O-antigen/teichoic acid export membrane protein